MQSNSRISSLMSAFPPCTFSKASESAEVSAAAPSVPHAYLPASVMPPGLIFKPAACLLLDDLGVDLRQLERLKRKLCRLQSEVEWARYDLQDSVLGNVDAMALASSSRTYAKAVKRYRKSVDKLCAFFASLPGR